MRRAAKLVFFLAFFLAIIPLWAETGKPRTVRVLFIGNSLVYSNDLPSLFVDFAEATYPNLEVVAEAVTAPGESLQGHWESGTALKKLQGARWDYVVLQDQGQLPLGSFTVDGVTHHERPDPFFESAERFARAVIAAQARPVFYQTYVSRSENLPYIDYAYMTIGRKTGALVAPVARAWYRLLGTKEFDLYHQDRMHPSVHGSYLIAASLAATIFGDLPEKESVQRPAAVADGAARQILTAVRSVRAELAPTGGYAEMPVPAYGTRPVLQASLPIDPAMSGSWYAIDNGMELSLGSRLTLSFDAGAPRVELVDYTLHDAFVLPVTDLGVQGNVIRFTTVSQNRTYQLQVARRETGLEVLVERPSGRSSIFTHIAYGREATDHFEFLDKQYAEIAGTTGQESFEAALLRHYQALSGRMGTERLSRILLGQTPTSDPWWSIMTGWEYTRRQQHDAALRFLTFSTHRFPQSAEACQNLSRGLEAAGRLQEAYEAILKAESLITKEHHPGYVAIIQEDKARLQKLREGSPSPGPA